jgi:hypothetical protein
VTGCRGPIASDDLRLLGTGFRQRQPPSSQTLEGGEGRRVPTLSPAD